MVDELKPMSIPGYLDYHYPLNSLMGDKAGRRGRVKIHHLGECAITVEWKDGTQQKINVDPGHVVYQPYDYDPYENRMISQEIYFPERD